MTNEHRIGQLIVLPKVVFGIVFHTLEAVKLDAGMLRLEYAYASMVLKVPVRRPEV